MLFGLFSLKRVTFRPSKKRFFLGEGVSAQAKISLELEYYGNNFRLSEKIFAQGKKILIQAIFFFFYFFFVYVLIVL